MSQTFELAQPVALDLGSELDEAGMASSIRNGSARAAVTQSAKRATTPQTLAMGLDAPFLEKDCSP
jgi:hypothetical protein